MKEVSEDHSNTYTRHLETKRYEVWWYRQGATIATAIVAVVLWFTVIGPKVSTPKTEMVDPATATLEKGLTQSTNLATVSQELKFKVIAPDFKQLGAKLTRVGKSEFGGQKAAVLQYQYGKSVLLLYNFSRPSSQFKDMKQVRAGKSVFYLASADSVAVISWKDRRTGYFALAAKATEKDLINLAAKMIAAY